MIFVYGIYSGEKIIINEDSLLKKFRLSLIDELFFKLYKDHKIKYIQITEFNKEIVPFYNTKLKQLFKNLRQAKRYINSLYSSLPLLII